MVFPLTPESSDNLLPFLNFAAKPNASGEPTRALILTLLIAEVRHPTLAGFIASPLLPLVPLPAVLLPGCCPCFRYCFLLPGCCPCAASTPRATGWQGPRLLSSLRASG